MTESDFVVLDKYVRETADTMGLKDWEVIVMREPAKDDAAATCMAVYGQRSAGIYFDPGFRDYRLERQVAIVAHELLHCHFASCSHAITYTLKEGGMLSTSAHALFSEAWQHQFEYGIDATARAWGAMLPRIPWPDETTT